MVQSENNKLIKAVVLVSLADTLYAAVNLFVGIKENTWWFITTGIYYLILSIARIASLLINKTKFYFLTHKFTAWMLMLTALPLFTISWLCYVRDTGNKFHEIIMIAIALYAFSKISLSIVNFIKSEKKKNLFDISLRSISLSSAIVSIASLQRSMLVSFGEMSTNEIRLFNAITSVGASLIVFLIGLLLSRVTYKN